MRKSLKLVVGGGCAAALIAGVVFDGTSGAENTTSGASVESTATVLQPVAARMTAEKTADFTLTIPVGTSEVTAEGEARFDPADLAVEMTMDLNGRSLELRIVD